MSGTSQFTCSVLKLPPDQVPFFKLKDILEDVSHKFDQLNLVLASTENEDAAQPLREMRAMAAEETTTVLHAVGYADDFSSQILELLDAVATRPTDRATVEDINYNSRWAGNTAELFENGDNGLTQLTKDMPKAAEQIVLLLKNEKPGTKPSDRTAFNAESERLLADLLAAVRESASILRLIGAYYRDVQTHLADLAKSIATTQPSEEESEMVRQRWAGFSAALTGLPSEIGKSQQALEDPPPTVYRADDPVAQLAIDKMNEGKKSKRTSHILRPKLLGAPPSSTSAPSKPNSVLNAPWKTFRSFFKRLFSRFSSKKVSEPSDHES